MKSLLLLLSLFQVALCFSWSNVGFGVVYSPGVSLPAGPYNVFAGYGGYGVTLGWTQVWVENLFNSYLTHLGVSHIYAIQGPEDPEYAAKEIGNSHLLAHLLAIAANGNLDNFFVAGHSSGSFVAHEMLGQAAGSLDPKRLLRNKIVYFNLDGGSSGFTQTIANYLVMSHWTYGYDNTVRTSSANAATMQFYGKQFGSKAQVLGVNADSSGCDAGAVWCMHMTMITKKPHLATTASAQLDYGGINSAHPVQTQYWSLAGYNAVAVPAGDLCVTANPSLALRMTDCTNGKVMVNIKNGAFVKTVSCCPKACGYTWREVSYNGQNGYVLNQYLQTLCLGPLTINGTAVDVNAVCETPALEDDASSFVPVFTLVAMLLALFL